LERYSYSWKKLGFAIGKAWDYFRRETKKHLREEFLGGLASIPAESSIEFTRGEIYAFWEVLLSAGGVLVGEDFFCITEEGKVVCF